MHNIFKIQITVKDRALKLKYIIVAIMIATSCFNLDHGKYTVKHTEINIIILN